MSRILRRPMFRGGPVSSYGTGIASGLGYNAGGRVGYSNGGSSGLDFLKKAFLGRRFTDPNYQPPQLFPKNVSSFNIGNFGQSPADLASALSEGSAYAEYLKKPEDEFETITTDSGDVKLKLDEKGNPIKKEEPKLTLAEQIDKQRIEEITAKDTQGADLEMFKRESEVLPREKIEQAAATLDIKDKIATKRAKEQLKQTLAGIDYKIGATAAAAKKAGDVANMDFYDGTEYIAANVFKGNKRPNSPAVIAETLRQKFKMPTYKITKEEDQVIADTLKEGFTVVVTSDGVKVFLKEGNKVTRQPQFEIG
jgi:hypothetical protein